MCWKQKTKLYLQQRAKQLSQTNGDLSYISKDHLPQDDKEELSKTFGRVLDMSDVQKSTKGSKGAMPALIVQGTGTGTIMYVKQRAFARPGGTGKRQKGQVTSLKECKAKLQSKRYAQVLILLREVVEKTDVARLIYKDNLTGVMALAAFFGNTGIRPGRETAAQKEIVELVNSAAGTGIAAARSKAMAFLWESVKPTLDSILTYYGPVTKTPRDVIRQANWIAELCQVDTDKILKEVSKQKGFTVPKSWDSLNEDGTPKVTAAKKTKSAKKTSKKKSG